MENDVAVRDDAARQNIGDWQTLSTNVTGVAGAIASLFVSLFASQPEAMQEISGHIGVQRISMLNAEIRQWFDVAGGFSAVGRAHEIPDVEITGNGGNAAKDDPVSEAYLRGYYHGGAAPASVVDKVDVAKPDGAVALPPTAMNRSASTGSLCPQVLHPRKSCGQPIRPAEKLSFRTCIPIPICRKWKCGGWSNSCRRSGRG